MAAAARGLVFIVCAALLVSGLFGKTFSEAERYGYLTDIMPGDWAATNVWLDRGMSRSLLKIAQQASSVFEPMRPWRAVQGLG